MSRRTQKVGLGARFGPRYGVSVRRRATSVLKRVRQSYTCPVCQYQKVKRVAAGVWTCKKCDHTFAGGVWEPFTRATVANQRIIRRSVEGATATDMAVIAQQAAVEFERQRAEAAEDSDSPLVEIATEGDDDATSEEE
ncbi:MAG: 50S ribosomal protein L37ae [Methanobacteriota archaeon]|nr:MAG: 50S ribosomal protein L37ae [Euryarchaeota archaeon]